MAHAGGLDLDLDLAGPDVDELDVVADLEGGVADVAEQCSAHVLPPGGWSRTRTRSSLTVRQMRNQGVSRTMSGFYKYAQAEPDFVAVVDPDGTEHPPATSWPGPTGTSTPSARSGWRRATPSPRCSPTG